MRFHLNGHRIEFRPATEKFELHYMSPLLTLGVKWLIGWTLWYNIDGNVRMKTNCYTQKKKSNASELNDP